MGKRKRPEDDDRSDNGWLSVAYASSMAGDDAEDFDSCKDEATCDLF